jgi:hypothetical protein
MGPDSKPRSGVVPGLVLEGEVFYFVAGIHGVSFAVLEMQSIPNTKLPKNRLCGHFGYSDLPVIRKLVTLMLDRVEWPRTRSDIA